MNLTPPERSENDLIPLSKTILNQFQENFAALSGIIVSRKYLGETIQKNPELARRFLTGEFTDVFDFVSNEIANDLIGLNWPKGQLSKARSQAFFGKIDEAARARGWIVGEDDEPCPDPFYNLP